MEIVRSIERHLPLGFNPPYGTNVKRVLCRADGDRAGIFYHYVIDHGYWFAVRRVRGALGNEIISRTDADNLAPI
jgi:hypothetical protein